MDDNQGLDFSVTGTSAQSPEEYRREFCLGMATKLMIDTEIFKNNTVNADDLGPFLTEIAQGIEHYLIDGTVMEYKDFSDQRDR